MRLDGKKNGGICGFLRAAACGAMLARGLPMAAVSAGWELAAAVGVKRGEALSLVIFLLGCPAVIITAGLKNERMQDTARILTAVLYTLAGSGRAGNRAVIFADCLMMCFALLAHQSGRRGLITACLLTLASASLTIWPASPMPTAPLLPLAAACLCGTAFSCLPEPDEGGMLGLMTGAAAAMAVEMMI